MARNIIGKRFDILETTEEILKAKQPRQYQRQTADSIENRIFSELRKQWSISPREQFASLIWNNLLLKARNYPKPIFRDDMSELRQEMDALKVMVKSLTNTINELSKENKDIQHYPHNAEETHINSLCQAYIQTIKDIKIAKELYISYTNGVTVCWTIVDTEPFNSILLEPIYNAHVDIYTKMESTLAFDFRVINLQELNDPKELLNILHPNAKLIWRR